MFWFWAAEVSTVRATRILRQGMALALSVVLAAGSGCGAGTTALRAEDLADPPPAKSYLVTAKDGREWTFISLHMEGTQLVGTVRITETATEGEGEEARTVVSNRYEEMSIPWADVARVEAEGKRRKDPAFYLAAGAVVVGVVAFVLLTGNNDNTSTGGGGGKGF